MKKVCAWCKNEIETVDSRPGSEEAITHGVCGDCRNNMLFQQGVELDEYIDSLELPIVVVNSGGRFITGNDQARTLLGKELSEIRGRRGGEVFECAYARLPEGCGNTIHCSGCTIRQTVMETYKTGRSFFKVPALLNRDMIPDSAAVKLLISTEKIDDYVLLRIDEMEGETTKHGRKKERQAKLALEADD